MNPQRFRVKELSIEDGTTFRVGDAVETLRPLFGGTAEGFEVELAPGSFALVASIGSYGSQGIGIEISAAVPPALVEGATDEWIVSVFDEGDKEPITAFVKPLDLTSEREPQPELRRVITECMKLRTG